MICIPVCIRELAIVKKHSFHPVMDEEGMRPVGDFAVVQKLTRSIFSSRASCLTCLNERMGIQPMPAKIRLFFQIKWKNNSSATT